MPRSVLEAVVTWLVNTHLHHVLEITDPAAQLSVCPGSGRLTLAKVALKVVLCKRLIGEVVQSRRRPLLWPSPG